MNGVGAARPTGPRRPSQRRRSRWIVGLLALTCVAAACGGKQEPVVHPVSYRAADSNTGKPVSLAQLRGRPVLLSSWATWCAPCRKELPALERLHRAQGNDGLRVVAVNLDSDGHDADVRAMVDELGLTMTQWHDDENTFTLKFHGFGVPMSILLDREGQIVKTWHGALHPDDPDVRRELDKVLRPARS